MSNYETRKPKLAILTRSFAKSSSKPLEYLQQYGFDIEMKRNDTPMNENRVAELIGDADAVIVGSDKIGSIVLEQCRNLKIISKHGVGLDNVDLEQAKERNITVTNTPGVNHESVAELTWLLILATSRNLLRFWESMQRLEWNQTFIGNEVYKKTIGIIGFGNIGKAVARRAISYECKILVYEPYNEAHELYENPHMEKVSLERLFAESDIITLHAPLTKDTYHMLNEQAFKKMKDGIILINTSRGELIDEDALFGALEKGKVKAVGLDVFIKEPPFGSKLLESEKVIATPHIGTHTVESNFRMGMIAAESIVKFFCTK